MTAKKPIPNAPDIPLHSGYNAEGEREDDYTPPAGMEEYTGPEAAVLSTPPLPDSPPVSDYASEIAADPQRHLSPITNDVERDPSLPPPPITPSTPSDEAQERVLYENWLNGEAESFGLTARLTFANATIAGYTARLVVEDADGNVVESDRDGNVTVVARDTDGYVDEVEAEQIDPRVDPYADDDADDADADLIIAKS